MSPPTENAPPFEWGASETIPTATARTSRLGNGSSTTHDTARHQLALAKAGALALVTTATANGTWEATQQTLEATAGLACSLAFDLWLAAA